MFLQKHVSDREKETPEARQNRIPDFLDFLFESEENGMDTTNDSDLDRKVPKKLTRTELVSSAKTFMIGGADTMATLVNYCLFELAKHPEMEEIIMQEIDDYIKTGVSSFSVSES